MIVTFKGIIRNADGGSLKVESSDTKKIYKVECGTNYDNIDFRENDRISLIGNYNGKVIKIKTYPLAFIPIKIETINPFLKRFHIDKLFETTAECEKFAEEISDYRILLNNNQLTESLSIDTITRSLSAKFVKKMKPKLVEIMINKWHEEFDKRQLKLFKFDKEDIENCDKGGILQDGIRKIINGIKKDPCKVPQISYQRTLNLLKIMGRSISEEQKKKAKLLKDIWNDVCAGYVSLDIKTYMKSYKGITADSFLLNYPVISKLGSFYFQKMWDMEENLFGNLLDRLLVKGTGLFKSEIVFSKSITKEQKKAVKMVFDTNNNISIITGEAGTGKTYITTEIVRNLNKNGIPYILLAPTGVAAARIKETIGPKDLDFTKTMTIDMFVIKGTETSFKIVIIDESSMISYCMAYRMLDSIPKDVKIVFLGDVEQLRPISNGFFFSEIIQIDCISKVKLIDNHRVKQGNIILKNAQDMINGKLKKFRENENFSLIDSDTASLQDNVKMLLTLFKESEIERNNICILCPYNKYIYGYNYEDRKTKKQVIVPGFNDIFWAIYCPKRDNGDKFQLGKKVMMKNNNYDIDIMNGEEGLVNKLCDKTIIIDFNSRIIEFKRNKLTSDKSAWVGDLDIAHSKSVHKSQGWEVDHGIIVIPYGVVDGEFLNMSMLYVAITRCKKSVWLLGDRNTIMKMTKIRGNYKGEHLSDLFKMG